MSGLVFLQPLALLGLLALPGLYWLIRNLPPPPREVVFAPFQLLSEEPETPRTSKAPLWIVLLRLLIIALIIFAAARPQWGREELLPGEGPLLIIADNGWDAAPVFDHIRSQTRELLRRARLEDRPVWLWTTADPVTTLMRNPGDAAALSGMLDALQPRDWPAQDAALAEPLRQLAGDAQTFYLSTGLSRSASFTEALARRGATVLAPPAGREAALLLPPQPTADGLLVRARRASAGSVEGRPLMVLDATGGVLAAATLSFDLSSREASANITMATSTRNEVATIRLGERPGIGGAQVLDARWFTPRIGLIAAPGGRASQPLLDARHYLRAAFGGLGELEELSVADAVTREKDVWLVPGDIRLDEALVARLREALGAGAVVIRFAGEETGPNGNQTLLPVALREVERRLGGALTWEEAQALAPFDARSPFAGIDLADRVRVNRQILASPTTTLDEHVWARLADGTPVITGRREGQGTLVLFHTSLDPEWTTLAQDAAFVRLAERLSAFAFRTGNGAPEENETTQRFALAQQLTNQGRLNAALGMGAPLTAQELREAPFSADAPAGLYDNGVRLVARNLTDQVADLAPFNAPAGIQSRDGVGAIPVPLAIPLITMALVLLLLDALVQGWLSGRLAQLPRRIAPPAGALGALMIAGWLMTSLPMPAAAQSDYLVETTNNLTVGIVTDLASPERRVIDQLGWEGLSLMLFNRTSVETLNPRPIRLADDPLGTLPVIYWSVPPDLAPLTDTVAARLRAFLANGGVLILDTYDAGTRGGGTHSGLRAIDAAINLPPLVEPDPDHVMRRAFYLLDAFPGLWAETPLYVDARAGIERDGVSPVLITGADWTGAWALDETGRPVNLPTPGGAIQREYAYRTGINVIMYVLTGNYKADQVHVPAFLERLGREAQ